MATHLATRTSFSLLNSPLTVHTLVTTAKERGFNSLAITEKGVLFSAPLFDRLCKKHQIKPIFGCEVDIDDGDTLILLAKNNQGFKELIHLSSIINSKETLTFKDVIEHSKDCVVIEISDTGLLESYLLNEDKSAMKSHLSERKNLFRDYVCGISMMPSPLFASKNQLLIEICQSINLSCTALPRVYYKDKKDESVYRLLSAIKQNVQYDNTTLINQPYRELLSAHEMESIYGHTLCAMSDIISERCHVQLENLKTTLPHYPQNSGVSNEVYLSELCQAGLKKRFAPQAVPQQYQSRLQFELKTIIDMNYVDYFLIVYDYILFASRQDMFVGPGRGSAAGSLVAYSLGITHVDPIKYDLYFERFLNPGRQSMPDIDTDFPDNRRDEVINYVIDKYGQDHIAHIITFGTFGQKNAIRDVARVYGAPLGLADKIISNLVNRIDATLVDSLKQSKGLQYLLSQDKLAQRIVDMALKIEGLPKNQSTHAAGLVMSQKPLHDVIATTQLFDHHYATQYTMEYLEKMGLVKMDFLGLRNLTIIDDVVREIKKVKPHFNIMKISLEDSKTYRLIAQGHTMGIFQLESNGMIQLIKQVAPTQFMDVVDSIALFRPGPMQFRSQYIENKNNPSKLNLIHPDLKDIVQSSHGILIYQEQIMQVASKFAGFSLSKADILRRAMSKKDASEMETLKEDFINGCLNNGYSQEIAHKLFEYVNNFAAYGFNKSHSVAYAMIAYQMAYLKANYSLYFYKALLTGVIGSTIKLKQYLDECQRRRIKLLPPDVNHSEIHFTIEEQAIRLPLSIISKVGTHSASKILKQREETNYFNTFIDFVAQSMIAGINEAQIRSIISAGACDRFGFNRNILLASLESVIKYIQLISIKTPNESGDGYKITLNYGLVNEPTMTVVAENKLQLSQLEKEALGFYFKYHPILEAKRSIDTTNIVSLLRASKSINTTNTVAMVVSIKEIRSKKGDLMAFVSLEDEHDKIEAIIFNREWTSIKNILKPLQIYWIQGQGQKNRNYIIKDVKQFNL